MKAAIARFPVKFWESIPNNPMTSFVQKSLISNFAHLFNK